jgi:arabinofuranosyltransferase
MPDRNINFEKYILLFFFLVIVIRNAWISDDAYITFRVIENFLSDYGLTYNPYVRVQAFTHPAWMFLLSGVYSLLSRLLPQANNMIYYVAIFTSIATSVIMLYLILKKIITENIWAAILLVLSLTLSRAFIDYSTSGLENPLTHLLLVCFFWIYFSYPEKTFLLALISSLLIINRQDTFLLVLPALLIIFFFDGNYLKKTKNFLLGFLPVIGWELFSVFYYGFPFPNTAYAKLNTGIKTSLLIQQGLDYLLNSIHWDPLTLFVVFSAGTILFAGDLNKKERGKLIMLYLGVIVYIVYVVNIGGGFMSGRFLTAPLLLSVLILTRNPLSSKSLQLIIGVVSLLGVFSLRSTLLDPEVPMIYSPSIPWTENPLTLDRNGVEDERTVYFANQADNVYMGLVEDGFRKIESETSISKKWSYTGTKKVATERTIGQSSYEAGPNIYIVDYYALVDPLLARLPTHQKKWRIGHFGRDLPLGYLKTLETGESFIEDPSLAQYYQKLYYVISGPLWDKNRIVEIFKFNTGQYDYLIENYLASIGR